MKRIIIIFFWILGILASTTINFVVIADFALRYAHYANEKCENKDKPEMHCNGNCQLSKKLEKQSDMNAPSVERLTDFSFDGVMLSFLKVEQVSPGCITEQLYLTNAKVAVLNVFINIQTPPPENC